MAYKDIVLYVMSGTGNTYRVAQWMKELAEARSVPTEVMMIDDMTQANRQERRKNRLFGIMFPAHGLMAPWSMIKFLFRMSSGKGSPAVIVSTRGGIKLGRFIIPGAVGIGNFMAAIILLLKGYRIKGLFSLDMPANMINLHWGMNSKNVESILIRARKKIEPVMVRLLEGRRVFFIGNNLWELGWSVLLFWIVPLFPILYLLIGKLFMAKLMFSDNRCNGCGLCATSCPNQGIVMKQIRGKMRPFWTCHCEACMRCMGFCKKEAIQAGHSWGVLLYYITSVPVITFFINRTGLLFPLPVIEGFWLRQLINIIYIIPAIITSYSIFWLLIQIPVINALFAYTTLTRYFRRYHEPGTRLNDLSNDP